MNRREIHKQVAYALMACTGIVIITGLGITEPGIITPLTFGLFDKFISFRIHTFLWGPFCILCIIHIWLTKTTHPKKQ
ncbi:hypothetical protein [Methanospirillum hungatei]|uniref:hypothetical protein n=1 Tax=Methanospirillum hungatei TaxID=2203 RepID=UPI0026EACB9C|nr:hypothetical protein [Methanospirillum hungatei]MCA1916416.1 hypothetical protein [Methanospirillum hungatei]